MSKVRISVSSRISSRISVIRKTMCGPDEAMIRKGEFWGEGLKIKGGILEDMRIVVIKTTISGKL